MKSHLSLLPYITEKEYNETKCCSETDMFYYMDYDQVEFDVFDATNGHALDKTLSFDVAIQDINDNAPVFKPKVLEVQVPENIKEGEDRAHFHLSAI